MSRKIRDYALNLSGTLPNANATVNTNWVDLGAVTPYPTTEAFVAQIYNSAATGANNLNLTFLIQESATANVAAFTNVAGLAAPVRKIASAANVYTAGTTDVTLPPTVKRYVRVTATGEANGGNAADGSFGLRLTF